ncbi:hypothetical protein EON82_15445 [bacterium]|nr:MAG: hypothetical protein EON82_15445 [bacterium]
MRTAIVLGLAMTLKMGQTPTPALHVQDGWGREIDSRGITLLDWEGHLANPAVKLRVELPEGTEFPAQLYVHGTSHRLHFDRSDEEDRYGIAKRIVLPKPVKSVDILVSIFPDRDDKSENHELIFQLFGPDRLERTRMRMPVRVIDQDPRSWKPLHPIHIDYSQDKTGYFRDQKVRKVLRLAADDWAYFIDQKTDPVPARSETSTIWNPDGYKTSYPIVNRRPYTGYLLYVYGITHEENRAGGSPSLVGKPQTLSGRELSIRRSGSVEFDVTGNWNRLGWFLSEGDDDWWVSGNLRAERSDLYSIAVHEFGHAFAFEGTYPAVGRAKATGNGLAGEALREYLGQSPKIDASDHLVGITDPVSHYGGYGREFQGNMKARRWLLTKTHLLCLEAIGYKIRRTTAFEGLKVSPATWDWQAGRAVRERINARGGVPDYFFRVVDGRLPEGVSLDSFTGEMSGVPSVAGSYDATVEADDNDPTTSAVSTRVRIEVRGE